MYTFGRVWATYSGSWGLYMSPCVQDLPLDMLKRPYVIVRFKLESAEYRITEGT